MSIEMPDEVKWLLPIVVGQSWPEGDEDALRRLADTWREASGGIEDVTSTANGGAQHAQGSMEGKVADAFEKMWKDIGEGGEAALPKLKEACDKLAESCDNSALEVEHTKLTIIASLIALAIQIAAMVASAFVSFGASTAGIPIAQAATRVVVTQIFKQLVMSIAKNVAIEMATSLAIETAVQGIQVASGERKSLDGGKFGEAAVSGAIGGAVGGAFDGVGKSVGRMGGDAAGEAAGNAGSSAGRAAGDAAGDAAGNAAGAAGRAAGDAAGEASEGVAKNLGKEAVKEGALGAAEGATASVAEQAIMEGEVDWGEVGTGAMSGGVTGAGMGAAGAGAAHVADGINTDVDTSGSGSGGSGGSGESGSSGSGGNGESGSNAGSGSSSSGSGTTGDSSSSTTSDGTGGSGSGESGSSGSGGSGESGSNAGSGSSSSGSGTTGDSSSSTTSDGTGSGGSGSGGSSASGSDGSSGSSSGGGGSSADSGGSAGGSAGSGGGASTLSDPGSSGGDSGGDSSSGGEPSSGIGDPSNSTSGDSPSHTGDSSSGTSPSPGGSSVGDSGGSPSHDGAQSTSDGGSAAGGTPRADTAAGSDAPSSGVGGSGGNAQQSEAGTSESSGGGAAGGAGVPTGGGSSAGSQGGGVPSGAHAGSTTPNNGDGDSPDAPAGTTAASNVAAPAAPAAPPSQAPAAGGSPSPAGGAAPAGGGMAGGAMGGGMGAGSAAGGAPPSGGGSRPGSGGSWTGTAGTPGASSRPIGHDGGPRPDSARPGPRADRPTDAAARGAANAPAPPRPGGTQGGMPSPRQHDGTPGSPPQGPASRPDGGTHRAAPQGPGGPSPRPDSGTPRPDGAPPHHSGNAPRPDGTGRPDSSSTRPDSTASRPDSTAPRPDSSPPRPDGTAPRPGGATPRPDGPGQRPDASTPRPTDAQSRPTGPQHPDGARPDGTADSPRPDDAASRDGAGQRTDTDGTPHDTPDAEPGTPERQRQIDDAEATRDTTPGGSSYHRDANMQDLARRVPDDGVHHSVDVHALPDGRVRVGDQTFSSKEFADMMRRDPNWDGTKPIRLLSCDAGDSGLARDLSSELGVPVTAPRGLAWTDGNGRVFSSDMSPDGGPGWPPNGGWDTHHPDGTTTEASSDGFHPSDDGSDPADAESRGKRKIDDRVVDVENKNSPTFKDKMEDRIRDSDYQNKYYTERSDGAFHRKQENMTDQAGDQVPLVRRDDAGELTLADDQIKVFHTFDGATEPYSATPAERSDMQDAVTKRQEALEDLRDKKKTYDGEKPDPSPEATDGRRDAYATATKASEDVGDHAADLELQNRYGIDPKSDDVNTDIDDFDPDKTNVFTGEGSGCFDKIAITPDGKVVVIEAKAPHADLGSRLSGTDRVEQGTRPYYEGIVNEMRKRGEVEASQALADALRDGKVEYRLVRATIDSSGSHDVLGGYDSTKFDLGTPANNAQTPARSNDGQNGAGSDPSRSDGSDPGARPDDAQARGGPAPRDTDTQDGESDARGDGADPRDGDTRDGEPDSRNDETDAQPDGPDQHGDGPEGQLTGDALRDRPSFEEVYDRLLEERGLDRAEHDRLRHSPADQLTEAQMREVIDLRDAIQAEPGTVMAKVLNPKVVDFYLDNDTSQFGGRFDPASVQGFVARGTDVADFRRPAELRDALALDDQGAGWSPIQKDAEHAHVVRYHSPKDFESPTAYGGRTPEVSAKVGELAGVDKPFRGDDPFMGTGYTGGGVPEFSSDGTHLDKRAEMWRLDRDGNEVLVGVFHPNNEGGSWVRVNGH